MLDLQVKELSRELYQEQMAAKHAFAGWLAVCQLYVTSHQLADCTLSNCYPSGNGHESFTNNTAAINTLRRAVNEGTHHTAVTSQNAPLKPTISLQVIELGRKLGQGQGQSSRRASHADGEGRAPLHQGSFMTSLRRQSSSGSGTSWA